MNESAYVTCLMWVLILVVAIAVLMAISMLVG